MKPGWPDPTHQLPWPLGNHIQTSRFSFISSDQWTDLVTPSCQVMGHFITPEGSLRALPASGMRCGTSSVTPPSRWEGILPHLTCMCLGAMVARLSGCASGALVCLLWRSVHSSLLPIFQDKWFVFDDKARGRVIWTLKLGKRLCRCPCWQRWLDTPHSCPGIR